MLIDIFARRYDGRLLRDSFEQRDSRLLVQAFRILAEDIYPIDLNGKEDTAAVSVWSSLHSQLSRELGLTELSTQAISYTTKWNGNDYHQTYRYPWVKVCENWLLRPPSAAADRHIKERLSLIELGFRHRGVEIAAMNAAPFRRPNELTTPPGIRIPGDPVEAERRRREAKTQAFQAQVDELNARFRQAGYPLNYHNGFIQIVTDDLAQREIETPFWALVASPLWVNVDLDMKEALDRRDSNGRDPAFYAARALESTIKIISDGRGWTHGKERGAHNFLDNLAAKSNALIENWESDQLKGFFTHVRNPLGHGPGSAEMPSLSRQQIEWAIEFSMTWIKNLIRRM